MDDINALLGMGLEDEEELRALADSLRGRKRAADWFAATTVIPLREAANREQSSIAEAAAQGGVLKKALEDRRNQKSISDANRLSSEQQGQLDRESRERIAAMQQAGANKRALNKALSTKSETPYGYLRTAKEREQFKSAGEDLARVNSIVGDWKEEYGPSVQFPGVGTVENFAGRYLPTKKSLKEQAAWWSKYEEHLAMLRRHGLFGSAFTKNEKESWEAATITPSTDPRLVTLKLQGMQRLAQIAAEKRMLDAYEAGVSPEMIKLHYGNVIDVDKLLNMYLNDPEGWQAHREESDRKSLEFNQQIFEHEAKGTPEAGIMDQLGSEEAPAAAEPVADSGWTDDDERRMQELMAKQRGQQ